MEKKLPEFKPLPELGNVASNYMSAFNVGMNIYEALTYLQGYVQTTYNSMDDLINDWNNFETYVTENINQIANEKTQEILNQWLSDGTLNELISQNPMWNQKANKDDLSPRENLLINADFKRGIINQRGQTSYVATNKTTFTIDRWKIYYGTVKVNDGYVKYTNTDSDDNRAFDQYLGNQGDDTYTLYVNVRGISGSASVQMMDESAQNIITKELTIGDNVLTATGNVGLIRFFCTPGSSIEIYQVKLEKGLTYTGMSPWNKTEEMNKCIACFEVRTIVGIALSGDFSQAFGAQEGQYYLATGGFSEKVKTPTVEVKEIHSNGGVVSTISVDVVQGIKTNGLFSFKLNTTYTRPYLNFKCFIDSELY